MNLTGLLDRVPAPLRRRPILTIATAALLVLGILWIAWPKPAGGATNYHDVQRGDFTVSILEGGTLTAVSEVSIRNEVEGTARVIYIVPEGSFVKKGDLLVELDSAQAQDQVNQQQINFEKAQFGLIQAQAQLDIQRSTTNSDIRAATLKLEFARLDLEKFVQGTRLKQMTEATNKLVQAEAKLASDLDSYINTTNLVVKGYETKQRADQDRLAVLGSRNSLVVASNDVWMLQEFDHRKEFAKATSDVEEAEKELARVIAQSQSHIAQFQADLITQSNTLTLNLNKLQRDRRNLGSTKIHAPQDGLVVYPVGESRFSNESLIEEGAVVRNRQELIKLPDTSRMKVTIKVHESHVNMIRPGLPAYVILDSMPDERFAGTVEKVGLLPDTGSRWGNPNLKVYNTEIHITDPLPDVKPGVSAKAEVIVTNISNTLSVPIQAVTTLKGRQVVYLAGRGADEARPVGVGLYNTRFIEITSGLKEGDRVLLAPPFDSQERDLEGSVLTAEEKTRAATNAPRPAVSAPALTSSAPGAEAPPAIVSAPGAGPQNQEPGAPRRGGQGGINREELMKQYDKDGDGELNEAEREAMRAAMPARAGGAGGQRFNREEMLKRFDTDGDGELSETERAAMRQSSGGSRTNRTVRPRGDAAPQDGAPGEGARPSRGSGSAE